MEQQRFAESALPGSLLPSSRLLVAVREFTTTILNPYDLQELLHRLTEHASAVTGSYGAGVMLTGQHGLAFAAASDDLVIGAEVTQDRVESGPCHAAFSTGEIVTVEDLQTDSRWPEYRNRVLELGLRAVAGFPMRAWGQTIGVLDLYRREAGPWTDTDVDAGEMMTSMGAGYILHANQLQAHHDLAEQLQTALDSRDTIGQAKGVLMARHGVDAAEAFETLHTTSQRTNVKLREVAADLLERESALTHD